MIETNIPVILLKEIIVLPFNEIRIEFVSQKEKDILNGSEMYHDNYLLLVNLEDPLEENPSLSQLPSVAILGKVKSKITLPGGTIRVVIAGIDRVSVVNYFETSLYLQAFVVSATQYDYDNIDSNALKRVLYRSLEEYISLCSFMSNEVLGRLSGISNIGRISDIVISELPLEYKDKVKYIDNVNPTIRTKLLLSDLNKEIETIKLENEIETSLKTKLDEEQKKYFLKEKIRIMKEELGETTLKDSDIENIKNKVDTSNLPDNIKNKIELEITKYELTPSNSPEIGIVRNYIEWLLNLPWNISTKDNYNIEKANKILDESHYGLKCVKERIIEFIACKKKKKNNFSEVICLVGPPGTGKTTLAKSIAKSLNKKFIKISVGGINDSAEIMGHRRTYMGAGPGKVITGLKKVGVNNPVFLIDEIDKMSKDYKGDPMAALLDILDKEQNKSFIDNYIEEEFDLSNVTFILTANSLSNIPPALKDRLEIINLSSYTLYEKLNIAKSYLIPCIKNEYSLKNININDDAIISIIRYYTKEAGARELDRVLHKLFRKLIVQNITNIDIDNPREYLGNYVYDEDNISNNNISGIVNALAYTPYGGCILKTSTTMFKGKGNITKTGSLGDIIKESIEISLSYIKSNYKLFNIDYKLLTDNDFHIHFESASISKDGPSAGVSIVTALISLLLSKNVSNDISMTGEITLRGKILPVGGLREKLVAAQCNNIKTIFIPLSNKNEILEMEEYITKNLEIIYVDNYIEIYNKIFKD